MNVTGPRDVRSASAEGPATAEIPWTNLAPPEPLDARATEGRTATGRRVTQETVDRMADLRREGTTLEDIATQLGCSERTVRRYAGKVEREIVPPPAKMQEDPESQRVALLERYTEMLKSLWDRFPSVSLADEAIRQLAQRIHGLRPETLRLLGPNRTMRLQFFKEAVGPLFDDYAAFEEVARFLEQFPDHKPLFWRPRGEWIPGDEDEAGQP